MQGKQYSCKCTIYINKTYYKKRSCRRFEKENTSAQHSDFILISFLLPVIAQSGVNPRPVVVPADLDVGALDGSWFHHCRTLTRSDMMPSVRAPDNSPLRLVLWQEHSASSRTCLLIKPRLSEAHPKRSSSCSFGMRFPGLRRGVAEPTQTRQCHVDMSDKVQRDCWSAESPRLASPPRRPE